MLDTKKVARKAERPHVCTPIKHLPPEIRRAFAAAKMRPVRGQCYSTAANLVVEQDEVPLLYVEGTAERGDIVIPHAWVRHAKLGDVDLFLSPADQAQYTYRPTLVLPAITVCSTLLFVGTYGPWADDPALADIPQFQAYRVREVQP